MTTAWKFQPVHTGGPHLLVVVHSGPDADRLARAGTLCLRREEYGDLAARFGYDGDAFDTKTGRALLIALDPIPAIDGRDDRAFEPGETRRDTVATGVRRRTETTAFVEALRPADQFKQPTGEGHAGLECCPPGAMWPDPSHRGDDEPVGEVAS